MMKEDMDQSIKIHKLRKECKDPCFNSCEGNVGFPCFNSYDPDAREMNSDMYYKIKMMKEDMDQSIKIHKLRKECKDPCSNSREVDGGRVWRYISRYWVWCHLSSVLALSLYCC